VDHGLDMLAVSTIAENVESDKGLDAQAIGRLVAEYLAGRTAAEVGEQYGLAKSSVLELVRQAGKSVRHFAAECSRDRSIGRTIQSWTPAKGHCQAAWQNPERGVALPAPPGGTGGSRPKRPPTRQPY
jgi:hypothetical protein